MQIPTFLKTRARNTEQKIFKLTLLVILPLLTIITVYSFISVTANKDDAAKKMIRTQNADANKRITLFFEPLFRDIRYLQARGNTENRLNPEDPAEVQDFLGRFSQFYLQHVHQVLFWDGTTTSVYTLNEGNCTGPEEVADSPYAGFLENTLNNAAPDKIEWHPGIVDSDRHESSVLAASIFENPKSGKSYAFALKIDTTDFVADLDEYLTARLFLVSDLPGQLPLQFFLTESGKPDIRETNDPLVLAAFTEWRSGKPADAEAFHLLFDGKRCWVAIQPLQIKDRQLFSGLIIPEYELLTPMLKERRLFAVISSVSFGVVLIATVFLWRRYQQDIKQAALPPALHEMDDAGLLERIAAGENDRLEFKSTLRWNLRTNKPDKAMEIACLKTMAAFLNSEGGTLLVGVEDNGNILGIGADQFPNEDKFLLHFNNLINQHLGLEAAGHFSFDIRGLEGGSILIVDCLPSAVPIYVTHDRKEDFYVRVGPGTRPLTTSEAIEYIRSHFSNRFRVSSCEYGS